MKNFSLGRTVIIKMKSSLLFSLILFITCSVGYSQNDACSNCLNSQPIKDYIRTADWNNNKGVNSGTANEDRDSWLSNGVPGLNDYARFPNAGNYLWEVDANKTVQLKGLVLEQGVKLLITRSNANEVPVFDLKGGCVIVKKDAVLHFAYYTKLENLTICVQDGGKVIFDSQPPGNADGDRDKFVFKDINIVLAPQAEIKFGNAEIIQIGYTVIEGYTGRGCTLNNNGTLTPPPSPPANINVDLTKMSQSELSLFCSFLSNAGFEILPVAYEYIEGSHYLKSRSNVILWATFKEWENSHFEIERSINGISNWEKVGEVQGMGWTDEKTEYSFCDEKLPIGGGNIYYRLKQVDFNLKFEYSKTVTVKVPPLQVTKGKWRVYPNPVNDVNFYIARTELEEISSISVKVLSPTDQMRSVMVTNERELTEAVKKGFDKLPKGVFIVEIQWNQKVEYLKVIKN